ncbi:hypothetical protein pEaSNUABM5_00008 [Erwinia phage pEa_SNUABM_5]|uniref:Uncharacterized protein n=1 Tax=Erwinia phage pEa_SNUABM_5 TaxID=2797313 RepID=A0A7T8IVH4_9CAUD|nr:hypothetical protein MPK73_gp008 [Erwinia phage pEa_SNUABM_5]QQO90150.1 hypothetical protein pEaSNUABM5_00008 [Erwinia phage pEa_SNUABM_5]
MEQQRDNVKHRIYTGMPTKLPPFDSGFVHQHNRAALKLLLKAAPDVCQIVTLTDGVGAAYALRLLSKRNFQLRSIALEFNLHDLTFSGRIAHLFVRGQQDYTPLSRYFARGSSMLHELSQAQGNVIDMFCFGQEFHQALKQRERGKSIVFVEE